MKICAQLIDLEKSEIYPVEITFSGEKIEQVRAVKGVPCAVRNNFKAAPKTITDFKLGARSVKPMVRVIEALDGEIVTGDLAVEMHAVNGYLPTDVSRDILKIAVVNRYTEQAPVAVGFVRGFGLKKGAIASSVAHDSHNIVAVGTNDAALCRAVNAVIENRGGISAVDNEDSVQLLPLPIAGLMSPEDGYQLAETYKRIDLWVKNTLFCRLQAPFMVLSFPFWRYRLFPNSRSPTWVCSM